METTYKTEGMQLCVNCEYARKMFYKDDEKMIKIEHGLICLRDQRMTAEVFSCKDFHKK